MRYKKQPRISAARQYHALSSCAICRGDGTLQVGRFVWTFSAKPSPLSRTYKLRLTYQDGGTPKVFVEEPDLTVLAGGEKLPHVYQEKPTQLCLYLPKTGQWLPEKWINRTIVPWAILWLYYFEDWLATGDWKGGGSHP